MGRSQCQTHTVLFMVNIRSRLFEFLFLVFLQKLDCQIVFSVLIEFSNTIKIVKIFSKVIGDTSDFSNFFFKEFF
ncbi:hypothetical protein H8356DRAFT_1351696 [Neocallimastix lanati (nom. inval.)]|nr:hypothetical protein H8356DRAFT_1351696 [Neocallimastix sp. JGI-2020a]